MMDDLALGAAERIENNFGRDVYYLPLSSECEPQYCLYGAVLAEAAHRNGLEVTPRTIGMLASYEMDGGTFAGQYKKALRAATSVAAKLAKVVPTFEDCRDCARLERNALIYHFNDTHCDGGVMAAKLLREAAEVQP